MRLYSKLLLTSASLLLFTFTGWSAEKTVLYFALQYGNQDTGSPAPVVGSKDAYLSTLENIHGPLKEIERLAQKFII